MLEVDRAPGQLWKTFSRFGIVGRILRNEEIAPFELDAVPRERSLGVYGNLTIRRASPAEQAWVAQAEAAYMESQPAIALDDDAF